MAALPVIIHDNMGNVVVCIASVVPIQSASAFSIVYTVSHSVDVTGFAAFSSFSVADLAKYWHWWLGIAVANKFSSVNGINGLSHQSK